MFRFACLALVCLGAASAQASHWESFKTVHGKSYGRIEDVVRMLIFNANVLRISEHNLRHDLGLVSFRLGLNKFADLTPQEFQSFKGLRYNATAVARKGETFVPTVTDVPDTVDWRDKGYVTPVKDQAQCGSCWAFSATGSLEGQHFAKTGKLVSLSEQNLVDCSGSYGNQGCNGGLMDQAFQYIKANGGIDTEESYPYTAQDGTCHFKQNAIGATCTGFVDVKVNSESDLKNAVATVGPVSVAIDASNYSFQLYNGGIYDEPNCSSTMLDHGVLAVGYGTDNGKDYWLVKNSWGPSWGVKGYIQMSRNKNNQCGIATDSSYPTV